MLRSIFFSVTFVACLGCGSERASSSGAAPPSQPEVGQRQEPVQPGSYRLRLSAACSSGERRAEGVLTLRPIADGAGAPASASVSTDGALLWGRAEVDFERLSSCLPGSAGAGQEPIHPGVLVEVLHWDGGRRQRVLLVSTEAPSGTPQRHPAGGIALWVEHAGLGHMRGVWSRWELMGESEGRWEADLESRSP